MNRYLIISTTGMGDCLWGTPAIRALKKSFPDVSIDLLVHARWKELLEGNPNVDRILEYYPQWYRQPLLAIKLLRQRYRTVLIFHANPNIMRLLPLIPTGRVLAHQPSDWLRKQWIVDVKGEVHGIPKRLAMIEALGGKSDGGQMEIFFQAPEQHAVEKFFKDNQLSQQKYIYINVGASGAHRRWPKEKFLQLAGKILESTDHSLILGGGPGEKESIAEIRSSLGQERCTDSLKLNLKQDCNLIARARMLITCDTGPMHIGFATRVPTVAIFGPYDHKSTGPYDLEENKCFRILPSENKTLQDITVNEVWQTVRSALEV